MPNELMELLEMAMFMEIASQAVYDEGQNQTSDPGARALMKELAGEEKKHLQLLREIREKSIGSDAWSPEEVADLKISDYLTAPSRLQHAGLQSTLAFAIRREQQAMEFYSRMTTTLHNEASRHLCERLVAEELRHKQKLEILYDDLFYGED